MKKALTLSLVFAASVASAPSAVGQSYSLDYQRGPRIIHVPQPGEAARPATGANLDRRPEPAVTDDDDDDNEVVAPPPLPRPRVKPRAAATPAQPPAAVAPRWKLRNEPPPASEPLPSGPSRAVLSAPPPAPEGLTPLRPTPRFDGKAASGEKIAIPGEPARPSPMISETSPPIGYTPPTTPE